MKEVIETLLDVASDELTKVEDSISAEGWWEYTMFSPEENAEYTITIHRS